MTNQTNFYEPNGMQIISNKIDFIEPVNLGENIWILDSMLDLNFCNFVIKKFESMENFQMEGTTGSGVNKSIKDSMDLLISSVGDSETNYIDSVMFQSLHDSVGKIIQQLLKHNISIGWNPNDIFNHDTGYQIQKTSPGGKYVWHIENNQSSQCFETGSAARSLTYIIYLNDVEEDCGGCTGFLYQKIKVQPKAGRIVVFPPYWTHVHAGHPLLSGVKYIATGWFFSEAHKN